MLDAAMDLRDVQIAARHAGPRTTMSYDRARKNLDRRPNYILAAYSLWHLNGRASGAARAGETSGIADERAFWIRMTGTFRIALPGIYTVVAGLLPRYGICDDLTPTRSRTPGRDSECDRAGTDQRMPVSASGKAHWRYRRPAVGRDLGQTGLLTNVALAVGLLAGRVDPCLTAQVVLQLLAPALSYAFRASPDIGSSLPTG